MLNYRIKKKRRKAGTMTTEEYLQTPETLLPSQLAYGVMHVADAPSISHQRMVGELFLALVPHVRARQLGEVLLAPTDVILDYEAGIVVQPDLLFLSRERSYMAADRVHGAPDLVIEVLSPYPRIGRLEQQIGWFARYGVRECWLVSLPDRAIAVLTLNEEGIVHRTRHVPGERLASAVVPDFMPPVLD